MAVTITITKKLPLSVTFSLLPDANSFVLSYDGATTAAILFSDTSKQFETKLQAIPALSLATVSGSFSAGFLINGATNLLIVSSNTLTSATFPVTVTVSEIDYSLPLAVEYGFDLNFAVGKQLDVLGKYVGITRNIQTRTQNIVLNDDDFRTLIRFAIIQNNSGSSLAQIEYNMNLLFPGQFLIFDYQNMNMSYVLSSGLGSDDFFAALLQENLLPRPMAVGISVIVAPVVTDFFGFRTYDAPNLSAKPFNNYDTFDYTWIWLSYDNGIFV